MPARHTDRMGIEEERERIAADPERAARVAEHVRRAHEAVGAHLDLDVLEAEARGYLREHQAENLNPARRMTDGWTWALNVVDLVAEVRRLRDLCGQAVDALLVEYGPLGPAHPHVPTVLWDLAESAGRPNLRAEMNEMARVDDDF